MKVVAELRHGDLFHSSNIVSSIEFDRDDELFATAGVSRRIKIFSFATVGGVPTQSCLKVGLQPPMLSLFAYTRLWRGRKWGVAWSSSISSSSISESLQASLFPSVSLLLPGEHACFSCFCHCSLASFPVPLVCALCAVVPQVVSDLADVHCPVVEMPTRSKLSCLSWNQQHKAQVASSDYEGIVTVWDVTTCQALMEYEEHEKRTWSVDFSSVEPTQLVSGSDDGKVHMCCNALVLLAHPWFQLGQR